MCQGENEHGSDIAILENLVLDKPGVRIDHVRAVGKDALYLNWTVTEWNSPVTDYFLSVSLHFRFSSPSPSYCFLFTLPRR